MSTLKTIVSIIVGLVLVVFAIKYRKTIKAKAAGACSYGKGKAGNAVAWLKEAR